jgi:hypothetical protein
MLASQLPHGGASILTTPSRQFSQSFYYEKAGIFPFRLHLSSLDSIRIFLWVFGSIFSAANSNCYSTRVKEVLIKDILDRWQTAASVKLLYFSS